jgi:hypothetical protein
VTLLRSAPACRIKIGTPNAHLRIPDEADLPAVAIRFVIDYTVRGRTKSLTTETGITFCRGDETDKQIDELIEERDEESDPISTCDYE